MNRAILEDKKVTPCEDLLKWAAWFESANRAVGFTVLNRRKDIFVSTVFLGLDHGMTSPQWFETMVFGTSLNDSQERYETWEEAEKGHIKWVERARNARQVRHEKLSIPKLQKRLRKFKVSAGETLR